MLNSRQFASAVLPDGVSKLTGVSKMRLLKLFCVLVAVAVSVHVYIGFGIKQSKYKYQLMCVLM